MSVGVQQMVMPRTSGVAFTLNPLNGDRSQVAIDASWGLGEAVVSGSVTPDNFLVDKVMGEITSRIISDKTVEHVLDHTDHVVEREVEEERRTAPSLSDDEVRAVAALARRAERHYGKPAGRRVGDRPVAALRRQRGAAPVPAGDGLEPQEGRRRRGCQGHLQLHRAQPAPPLGKPDPSPPHSLTRGASHAGPFPEPVRDRRAHRSRGLGGAVRLLHGLQRGSPGDGRVDVLVHGRRAHPRGDRALGRDGPRLRDHLPRAVHHPALRHPAGARASTSAT